MFCFVKHSLLTNVFIDKKLKNFLQVYRKHQTTKQPSICPVTQQIKDPTAT